MVRATVIVLIVAAAVLPVIILLTRWLKTAGFAEYSKGLDVVPMLYAGGALTVVSLYGYLLLAMRRYGLVLAATSCGVTAGLAGGVFISLGSPSLADYAWLFLASQAAIASATVAAGEIVYRSHRRLSAS